MTHYRQLIGELDGLFFERRMMEHLEACPPGSKSYNQIRKWHNPGNIVKVGNHFETHNGIVYDPDPKIDTYYQYGRKFRNTCKELIDLVPLYGLLGETKT